MKAGRKPKHQFNNLQIGEKALLKGKAAQYPYQFIGQFNKKGVGQLKVIKEENKFFAERVL